MLRRMKHAVAFALLLFSSLAVADPVIINADQWARPRSGAVIVQDFGLAPLIEALDRQPDGVLVVDHARSDEGSVWAEELRAWLVALGVSSAQIVLTPRGSDNGRITVDVRGYRGRQ